MAYIDRDGAYPDEARYWKMVEDTITDVFLQSSEDASRLVRDLVRRMADASPQERLLSFHEEPFNVAATLLRRTGNETERQHYRSLRERNGWTLGATAALTQTISSGGRHAA